MALGRARGQEVIVLVSKDGDLQARIDTIQDCEVTYNLTNQEEGYLGETANRFDSIFNGVTFRITGHATNRQFAELIAAIRDRAQRRAGGAARVDLSMTIFFPNGDTVTVLALDCHFSDLPITVGSREDFVQFRMEGKTGEVEER